MNFRSVRDIRIEAIFLNPIVPFKFLLFFSFLLLLLACPSAVSCCFPTLLVLYYFIWISWYILFSFCLIIRLSASYSIFKDAISSWRLVVSASCFLMFWFLPWTQLKNSHHLFSWVTIPDSICWIAHVSDSRIKIMSDPEDVPPVPVPPVPLHLASSSTCPPIPQFHLVPAPLLFQFHLFQLPPVPVPPVPASTCSSSTCLQLLLVEE